MAAPRVFARWARVDHSSCTGARCLHPNLCSKQLTSVVYLMVSLWSSAAPLRCTVATAFSSSILWLWAAVASNCLWHSSHGPVSSKVVILNVFDFPTISAACPAPSNVWLMTVCGLLSILLSRFSSFSKVAFWFFSSCRRGQTCCWTLTEISCRTSIICCSIRTRSAYCRSVLALSSACCWSALAFRLACCWSALAPIAGRCSCYCSTLIATFASFSKTWASVSIVDLASPTSKNSMSGSTPSFFRTLMKNVVGAVLCFHQLVSSKDGALPAVGLVSYSKVLVTIFRLRWLVERVLANPTSDTKCNVLGTPYEERTNCRGWIRPFAIFLFQKDRAFTQ